MFSYTQRHLPTGFQVAFGLMLLRAYETKKSSVALRRPPASARRVPESVVLCVFCRLGIDPDKVPGSEYDIHTHPVLFDTFYHNVETDEVTWERHAPRLHKS